MCQRSGATECRLRPVPLPSERAAPRISGAVGWGSGRPLPGARDRRWRDPRDHPCHGARRSGATAGATPRRERLRSDRRYVDRWDHRARPDRARRRPASTSRGTAPRALPDRCRNHLSGRRPRQPSRASPASARGGPVFRRRARRAARQLPRRHSVDGRLGRRRRNELRPRIRRAGDALESSRGQATSATCR